MASNSALTSEVIALTEKKMDMSLDDIIKMSKKSSMISKRHRASNKSQSFVNGIANRGNNSRVQRFMDSRSSMRQGKLAQKRTNFQGNQFPLAIEASRKAAYATLRNRVPLNRNRLSNWKKPRVTVPAIQRMTTESDFSEKQSNGTIVRQKPQTLDSLFARMKEQRMKAAAAFYQQQQMQHSRRPNNAVGRRNQRKNRNSSSGGGPGGYPAHFAR